MLSAVVIDRSSDPSADTIDVSTSGSNTLISVNGANVYTGASTSISSLSIIGTAYGDTISFDYTGGNPVPDGTISVNGNGGTNALAASANSNLSLDSSGLAVGSSFIETSNVTNATITGGANTAEITVNGWAGNATVNAGPTAVTNLYALPGTTGNAFWAHPFSSVLSGPGYSYTTDDNDVNAHGNGTGDTAGIDDQGSPGSAVLEPNAPSYIEGNNYDYSISAYSFGQVTAQSYYTSDTALMTGAEDAEMHPTYSSEGATENGYGVQYTAVGYQSVEIDAFRNGFPVVASLYDDGSSGTAYNHPLSTQFQGPGYSNVAVDFSEADVKSYNSSDVADMDDNGASGGSNYITYPGYGYWQGNTSLGPYTTKELGFKTVNSVAFNNANDSAFVNDNIGGAYVSDNNNVQMQYGNGTIVGVYNFGAYANPHVSAYNTAPNGQYDRAQSVLQPYVVFYGNWTFV